MSGSGSKGDLMSHVSWVVLISRIGVQSTGKSRFQKGRHAVKYCRHTGILSLWTSADRSMSYDPYKRSWERCHIDRWGRREANGPCQRFKIVDWTYKVKNGVDISFAMCHAMPDLHYKT